VWHASVASTFLRDHQLEARARALLDGVGDPALGEWVDVRPRATHIRRRLTPDEAAGLEVMDIRGTPDSVARLAVVRHLLPPGWHE
jgi:hypothetical protein